MLICRLEEEYAAAVPEIQEPVDEASGQRPLVEEIEPTLQ